MGAVTYPDERVAKMIKDNFIPVQINVVDHPEFTDRFLARWTPTVFFMDAEGREHRRMVGYSTPDDFIVEMAMGLAQEAFDNQRYEEALSRYQHIVEQYPDCYLAPEALYIVPVCRYRATGDPGHLEEWSEVIETYPDSRWARAGDV